MRKFFAIVLCLFPLTGCTAPTAFYIRNMLPRPVKLVLVLKDTAVKREALAYREALAEPGFNDYQKMTKKLSGTVKGDSVWYVLPPNSTVCLGLGKAGALDGLQSVSYFSPQERQLQLNSVKAYETYFQHKSALVGAYVFWLDIEEHF